MLEELKRDNSGSKISPCYESSDVETLPSGFVFLQLLSSREQPEGKLT